MCLDINRSIQLPETQTFPVYKVYLRNKDKRTYKSAFRNSKVNFKKNDEIISNRTTIKLNTIEEAEMVVSYGLHCYLNKKDAIEFIRSGYKRYIFTDFNQKTFRLVEFIANKDDLVATGKFVSEPSAVFHKLKFNRVIPVKRK